MKIPSKINLVISPIEKCYKFLNYEDGTVATYPTKIEPMDVDFFTKLEEELKEVFEKTFLGKVNSFNIIIPDEYFALTSISLPKLNKQLSLQNIKTELQARFNNVNELDFEFFPIAQKQDTNIYLIKYVRKEIISQFHKVFSSLKKELASVTPRCLASQRGLLAREPKLKQRNYVIMDVREQITYVTICENTTILSFHQFDFGKNILSTTNIAKEESLFNHKPAQLAVLKARAAAKAKKGIPDDIVTAVDEDDGFKQADTTDEFEIIMTNWDNFMKQIQNILDNDFFYRNDIKFDDIVFLLPTDLHYLIDNSTLESEFDETGMEVKRKPKVVKTLERKQPYAKKPQLRKRVFATFTKQDKKNIQMRVFDIPDIEIAKVKK